MLTQWNNVESSNIKSIAWDSDSSEIIVMFRADSVYAYKAPYIVFENFLEAESFGKFLATTIKPLFSVRRVDEK